ncbi:PAS domain-containing sensor histidine kinase [Desulfobacca acetoxidans]|uniref:histidine kinase n=1 Tax=Desulfobacca acetoxidans (strain ATCC 700848 / DSM 11109 / ASRB2) TaxID=880072 RepID=F2NGX1_DESAR|nr:PAS domain S-box protein [Desulfobacca acetoxidans]AEB08742.1 PAS/PAC sensor signal transduction histidine kinase [Desulfobacca acetoxidans DSM 11109]
MNQRSKKNPEPKSELIFPYQNQTSCPCAFPRELYSLLFDVINDAVVVIDAENLTFVAANEKFSEMTGFANHEISNLSLGLLFTGKPPYSLAEAQEYIAKALQEGPQLFEWLAQDRHGRQHWVELNLTSATISRKRYLIATVRDISARKALEQTARQSENAHKALFQALQDVALLLDSQGTIIAANDAAAQRAGRPLAEIVGLNVYALLPEKVRETRRAKVAEVFQTGRINRFEDESRGRIFYHTVYPIFNDEGKVVRVGIYVLDITDDRQTRKELEKTQARLEHLLYHSPAALYSCILQDRCVLTYLSRNIVNLIGYTTEEVLSEPDFWEQHVHPEDRPLLLLKNSFQQGVGPQVIEYRFRHRDGTFRWLHDNFNLVLNRQDQPLEYIGSLIDVTTTRQIQEELELSEKRYRAIVESQSEIICRFRPDTTLTYVNEAFCRFVGKDSKDFVGRSLPPFLTAEDQPRVKDLISSLTPTDSVREIEYPINLPDGQTYWLSWISHAFFDDQGRIIELQGVGRDITKRKEAEEALRQSERRFRMYTEGSLVGVYLIQDNRFIYVNPVFARTFGYTPVELLNVISPLDLVHEDDRDLIRQQIANRLKGQPPEAYVIKGLHKNGSLVYCELLGQLVEHQGRPAILGSLVNVTRRQQAEATLRESEKHHRFLVETMNDGLGVLDERGGITYANPKICELLRYSAEELVGRNVLELLDQTNQDILRAELAKRRAGDKSPYEIEWQRKDGSAFSSIVSPQPIFDSQGEFKGSVGIVTDISARREAEIAALRREEYFRLLTENISDVIGLLTSEGVCRYLNPSVTRLLDYPVAELIGKNAFELVHPEERQPLKNFFSQMLRQTGQTFTTEVQLRRRDGSWRVWEVKGKNLLHEPAVGGVVINAQDITERKHLEAALRQSDSRLRMLASQIFRAQETERRRLSLELHDELGQSLTALKLQLKSVADKLRKDQARLKRECTSMAAYINEVVENVRRLAHDLSPSLLENVGLAAALRHLLDGYRRFYQITENLQELDGIDVSLSSQAQIHLYRIFQELFTNIEKHAQATAVTVHIDRTPDRLTVSVADNGQGFELGSTLNRSSLDVGLGLSSINERVHILGGALDISSGLEFGTHVVFTVPLQQKTLS